MWYTWMPEGVSALRIEFPSLSVMSLPVRWEETFAGFVKQAQYLCLESPEDWAEWLKIVCEEEMNVLH